jgi:ABC-type molybdate transport system ATPase subunit
MFVIKCSPPVFAEPVYHIIPTLLRNGNTTLEKVSSNPVFMTDLRSISLTALPLKESIATINDLICVSEIAESLVRTSSCVIFPTKGEVFIDNLLVNNLSDKELARVRLKKIGFVFQNFNLLAPLNVLENVMHPLRLSGTGKKEAKLKAEEALKKVNMESMVKSLPKNLSCGEQQRVAIARTLVTQPSIQHHLQVYGIN